MQFNSVKQKLLLILVICGLVASAVLASYTYITHMQEAREEIKTSALDTIGRSAQTFVVSTINFHNQFSATNDPAQKEKIRQDWLRTIISVDDAVIHDFGKDKTAIRLIGDEQLFGLAPQGGAKTGVKIPFEKEAAQAMLKDPKLQLFEREEEGLYRVSVPLYSDILPGCAECHSVDVKEHKLLGTLNAYAPMDHYISKAQEGTVVTALISVGIFAVCIVVLYVLILKIIIKPLTLMKGVTHTLIEELRQGHADLTRRVALKSSDELGDLARNFNNLLESLQGVVKEIASASDHLASASEESSVTTQQSADQVRSQQQEIQAIHSGMSNVVKAVIHVAESTAQAVDMASEAYQETQHGLDAVRRTQHAIIELAKNVEDSTRKIQELETNSKAISQIVGVINEIAEQTNLLALNAAIESARAGEQGRGFAVVAQEVRSLASRTQQSTQEIRQMIERLQTNTRQTVETMNHGQKQAEENVKQAVEASESLSRISQAVEKITHMNKSIASASVQQKEVIDKMSEGINSISNIADDITGGTRDMVSANESLSRLASHLSVLIEKFKISA